LELGCQEEAERRWCWGTYNLWQSMIFNYFHIRVDRRLVILMCEQEEQHLFVAHCWCRDLKPFDLFGLVGFDRGHTE
jgi:hypothetical protein